MWNTPVEEKSSSFEKVENEAVTTLTESTLNTEKIIDLNLYHSKENLITNIVRTMHTNNITSQEVRIALTRYNKELNRKIPIKYKNPATGQVYSGRGRRPKWIQEAMDTGTLEQYLV